MIVVGGEEDFSDPSLLRELTDRPQAGSSALNHEGVTLLSLKPTHISSVIPRRRRQTIFNVVDAAAVSEELPGKVIKRRTRIQI